MIDVAIIGAGMAGIACARTLRAAGVPVRVIDKGRGIGGRVATRRVDISGERITFDHGAQYLDQSEHAAAIAALAPSAVDAWDMGEGKSRIVGAPEMAALPKVLAQGLDITLNTRVTTVKERGSRWEIETEAGNTTASHVIVTVPAPQLAPILGSAHPIVEQAAPAIMHPCMTLMAAFDSDTPVPFTSHRNADAVLSWIARNDTKPGRSSTCHTWVAQAHPEWSAKHIDSERDDIKAQMVGMFCTALGVDPAKLRHAGLQGWRYGLVAVPLGQPFVSHGTLWAGGDWCCGSKLQDAWQSGTEIASHVLQSLDLNAVAVPGAAIHSG